MIKVLSALFFLFLHPVHVTLTSIDYVPATDSFRVFIRMYYDDFLCDFRLDGSEIKQNEFSDKDSLIIRKMQGYLLKRIIIKVNEKQLSGKINDIKLSDNEISMNLEYHCNSRPGIISVQNLIMTRLYADMSNMTLVKVNDFEEGVKLTSELTEHIFKIY